jgi:hypothetical protein
VTDAAILADLERLLDLRFVEVVGALVTRNPSTERV